MDNRAKGITALDLLQVGLILLKITGRITWSWFWVLSPLWLTGLIIVIILIILKRR